MNEKNLPPLIFRFLSLRTLLLVIYPLYLSLQNYAVLGSTIKIIIIFFFKKKRKRKEIGGGSSHPHGQSRGGRTTPMAKGWSDHPQKAKKKKTKNKKKKKGECVLGFWGWFGHPQKPKTFLYLFIIFWHFGVAGPPPQALGSGLATPKSPKAILSLSLSLSLSSAF
jgi:hypothetical protein